MSPTFRMGGSGAGAAQGFAPTDRSAGGAGGFGGGGGGADGSASGGLGGFGGGNGVPPTNPVYGSMGAGGGGLGAGGDIFVQSGASLTVEGWTTATTAGTVSGGVGGTNSQATGGAGQAFGAGIYLQGAGTLTLNNLGATETIATPITDDTGAATAAAYTAPAGYTKGAVSVAATGTGDLILSAVNAYSGGTTIGAAGTLELASTVTGTGTLAVTTIATAGSGAITFGSATSVLRIDAVPATGTTSFANVLNGFPAVGTIDLRGLTFGATTATASGTTLTVTHGATIETFTLGTALPANTRVLATGDGNGGTLLTPYIAPPLTYTVSTIADLNAAIADVNLANPNVGTYTITLAGNIAMGGTALDAFNLPAGDTLDFVGGGFTLSAGTLASGAAAVERGLFVYAGDVAFSNLTVSGFDAVGGKGGNGAGGGAGLGGGLFVSANVAGDPGAATLTSVVFANDKATGGAGGGIQKQGQQKLRRRWRRRNGRRRRGQRQAGRRRRPGTLGHRRGGRRRRRRRGRVGPGRQYRP